MDESLHTSRSWDVEDLGQFTWPKEKMTHPGKYTVLCNCMHACIIMMHDARNLYMIKNYSTEQKK